MIMNHAYLSTSVKIKPIHATITITSAMLDTLMSSTNKNTTEEKTTLKGRSNSPKRENGSKNSDDQKSALRFTPSQLNKVQKNRDDHHKSSLKHTSIVETLVSIRKSDDDRSPSKDSSKTYDSYRTSEPRKISAQELHRSKYKSYQDSDSGLESYRSREDHSPNKHKRSHEKSRNDLYRQSSSSASKSFSASRKSDDDSSNDDERAQSSSSYATPVGTPFSKKYADSEERRSSGFKRSFHSHDESHSANSSFDNSNYFTPEGSPNDFNSPKRFKTRWSDTSSFAADRSYSSWKHNTSSSSDQGVQPELIGYQMVGDSQFCRFGQQLLGLERVPMPNCPGRIGICVSGQTITDLHRRVKENFYTISDKLILMIGTNDFLRSVPVSRMCEELSALVKTLQKNASEIILLTLPPIPKLEKKGAMVHFKLLDEYNRHIKSLADGESLRIADISPLYMTSPPYQRCKLHLFEMYFGGLARRIDLIHLNRLGLELIRKYILDKFI